MGPTKSATFRVIRLLSWRLGARARRQQTSSSTAEGKIAWNYTSIPHTALWRETMRQRLYFME
jgi:hypothetical protein